MSAPTITLIITAHSPNDMRGNMNANMESLRDNTVWLDPPSAQSGLISVGEGAFTNYVAVGGSPAAAGAVRLTNTNEIRWAYGGNDVYRMRNNAITWDLSVIVGGTAYPIITATVSVIAFPYAVSFGANVVMQEIAEPGTPGSGTGSLFASGGGLCLKDDTGVVHNVGLYTRGAGLPSASAVPEGSWRYNTTTATLHIQINGAWVEV